MKTQQNTLYKKIIFLPNTAGARGKSDLETHFKGATGGRADPRTAAGPRCKSGLETRFKGPLNDGGADPRTEAVTRKKLLVFKQLNSKYI